MLYQVIGVGRKEGEFTPQDKPNQKIHYDNIVFHVVGLKKTIGVTGQIAEQLSIKTVDAGEIVEAVGGKIEQAVGRQFDFETRYENKKKDGKFTRPEIVKLLRLFNCKFEYLFDTDANNNPAAYQNIKRKEVRHGKKTACGNDAQRCDL